MNHNGKNERIKRRYVRYLKDAKRKSEATIDAALAGIDRFEAYNKQRDFAKFHIEQRSALRTISRLSATSARVRR